MCVIKIVDTTLRDGEQAPGVVFSKEDKLLIANLLDQVGVSVIEVGTPVIGSSECEAIAEIIALNLKAEITTWNRADIMDIKTSLDCGARHIHISLPVSDIQIQHKLRKNRQWVLYRLQEAVTYAREAGATVSVGAEDASRADFDFLLKYAELAYKLGAVRLRYADTVGILDPFRSYAVMKRLTNASGINIELHAHNDFGMAIANTLAGAEAGVQFISTTVTGLGERAGNCALESAVRVFDHFLPEAILINQNVLPYLEQYVKKASGINVYRPLVIH